MPKLLRIVDQEMTAGMGAVTLSTSDYVDLYRLYTSGSVALSGSASLAESGTPVEGMIYLFHYIADLDFNGSTLTIFGASIPDDLETTRMYIRCYYNGSAWEVTVHPDFDDIPFITGSMIDSTTISTGNIALLAIDSTLLASNAVTTAKINDLAVTNAKLGANSVTFDKLSSTLNEFIVTVPMSFEAGEQANYGVKMPYAGTLTEIRYSVTKAIAGTDSAIITPSVNGGGTTPATISIAAGTAINTAVSTTITAGNTFAAGQNVRVTTSKVTAGGKAFASLTFTRTA